MFSSIPIGHLPEGIAQENRRMDKYERRRLALQRILDVMFQGRIVDLAKKIDRDASYVSRMLYPADKKGMKRIGDDMVEHIEKAVGLPRGGMDGITPVDFIEVSLPATPPSHPIAVRPEATSEVFIAQFDTGGMGGNGLILHDQPGIIENWTVSREWLRSNVPYCTSPANLCIVTGFGDSMPGVFNPGDPVLVDRGIRSCDHDGIYFFRVGNEGFIKILQRVPGTGILVISQNSNYRDWVLREDMEFEVFGKVLKAWKGDSY